MVTIITEKLQNQTLEDKQFEPIKQPVRRTSDLTASPVSAFNFSVKKDTSHSSDVHVRPRHESAPSTSTRLSVSSQSSLAAPLVCIHGVPLTLCGVCSCVFHAPSPPVPPKKRHCRSLSIPGDSKCSRKWQPQASSVWRPVPTRPHSAKLLRARHSPLGPYNKSKSNEASPIQGYSNMQPPQSPGLGILGSLTPGSDMFSTPPDSPVPRPASASSGFWDSSQGSLNVTWLDTSPSALGHRHSAFRFRSLSMEEDAISSPTLPPPVSAKPCAAGSMPVIPCSQEGAAPLSPQRHRVPRCRSQPCVLPERKCGIKRRRDEDRPTIDLFKMKEGYPGIGSTSSARPAPGSGAKCVQFACQESKYSRGMTSMLTEPPECFLGLNTIASSPLDSHIPLTVQLPTPKTSPKKAVKFRGTVSVDSAVTDDDVDSGCDDIVSGNSNTTTTYVQSGSGTDAKDDEEPVFELEMSSDLDLEQIEKD